jgi:hypothetical protein
MNETLEQGGQESDGAPPPPDAEPTAVEQPTHDGFPGGDAPESSGFSWRLPGSAPVVMHSQGGIPNEFDHLFRDSDEDRRRSLMPSQSPIGVALPPGTQPPLALPPGKPPSQSGESQLPAYQPPAQQQLAAYPQQPYQDQTYQQAAYQQTTQVPVGAPSDDDQHTQAIPRVPVQPYAYAPQPGQAGGGGVGGGVGYEQTGERRSSTTPMLIAIGVFVLLIVIASVLLFGGSKKNTANNHPGGSGTLGNPGASPAAPSKAQADALYKLMTSGKSARDQANAAITSVEQCKDVSTAKATFTDAAKTRQSQYDSIKTLPVDQLGVDTTQLVSNLSQGWQYSADSEKELAAWANDNLTCTGTPSKADNRSAADHDGSKAGSFKGSAVAEWNAMAAKLGEPTIDISSL